LKYPHAGAIQDCLSEYLLPQNDDEITSFTENSIFVHGDHWTREFVAPRSGGLSGGRNIRARLIVLHWL
jgi:hypothetical protein